MGHYSPSTKQKLTKELRRAQSLEAICLQNTCSCSLEHHGKKSTFLRSQLLTEELMTISYNTKQRTQEPKPTGTTGKSDRELKTPRSPLSQRESNWSDRIRLCIPVLCPNSFPPPQYYWYLPEAWQAAPEDTFQSSLSSKETDHMWSRLCSPLPCTHLPTWR